MNTDFKNVTQSIPAVTTLETKNDVLQQDRRSGGRVSILKLQRHIIQG
jgi:hypothetical protein